MTKLTLREYRDTYSQLLKDASGDTKSLAGGLATYLTSVASSLDRSADEFDLLSIPGISLDSGKLSILPGSTDPDKVNPILMRFILAPRKDATISIDESVAKSIKKAIDANAEKRIAEAKAAVASSRSNAESKNNAYHAAIGDLSRMTMVLNDIVAGSASSSSALSDKIINGVCHDEYFNVVGCESGHIIIHTGDTIIRYVDKSSSIDRSLNLGRFRVSINLSGLAIKWSKLQNNVDVGHIHPHISGAGSVCLGTAAASYAEAIAAFDIGRALGYMKLVVHEYNPGSPYASFNSFEVKYNEIEKRKEIEVDEKRFKEIFESSQEATNWYDDEIVEMGA